MTPCQCCLSGLQPGNSGSICRFGNIDPILKRRLADLGVAEGSNITVKRLCLWGGPILLECGGQLLGIRQKEAAKIEVLVS
ncbi:ferrous iron transport protein A [Fontibacillus phaseoli]|uniref:Ferrous iron transport protein A n=1 Tax=Fontibacillus phaseoli TaxID=1416533 RepID=A0A369AU05_9BACL|nr:FeoA family protein [Fontibacillus phaseoli]RCX12493.1 ferrous iron transport protein A [Fontibacillus phaseoli]